LTGTSLARKRERLSVRINPEPDPFREKKALEVHELSGDPSDD
jgi:hypothetical protein